MGFALCCVNRKPFEMLLSRKCCRLSGNFGICNGHPDIGWIRLDFRGLRKRKSEEKQLELLNSVIEVAKSWEGELFEKHKINETPTMVYYNRTTLDGHVSGIGGVCKKYLVYSWEQMSPLSNCKKTRFSYCKSIIPDITCIPWVMRKIRCDISKDISQQVPVQNVNK